MIPALTTRQRAVLMLVIEGRTNKEIAARLDIELQTAKWHVSRLLTAYGVDCRASLVREALRMDPPNASVISQR